MKIAGSYTVPAAPEDVYYALQNPDVLSRAMPGCKRLARIAENEYEMQMNVVISSISGLFDGKVRLAEQNPPGSFRLIVDGSGRIGFLKGDGVLTLAPAADATEVRYDGEVQTGGVIAGVGQRLLDTTAKMIIKRFFGKFVSSKAEWANGQRAMGSGGPAV